MKTNLFKTTAILLFLTACAFSCEEKYTPDCESDNCASVNIKGTVYVKPSQEGLKNIPVEVSFIKRSTAWFPDTKRVASGKTDKNGNFSFMATIDTTFFRDYRLYVRIKEQKNYISSLREYGGFIDIVFGSYNENALKNINFEFYKKAILTINLNRTHTDDFEYFYVDYIPDNNNLHMLLIRTDPKSATNEILQIETYADVYTKVMWNKRLKEEIIFEGVDSLICKQNSNNVININY